jgi:predicted YcjX-like family ATPase
MADNLFDLNNLNDARGTTQAMVDNLTELRKLGGEFAGEFGRDFLSNANAINKAFNDAIGKAEQFNSLEISRKEALNVEKKIREEIARSEANLLTLTGKVDNILKPQFERTSRILQQKRAEYNQAVQSFGIDSQVAKLAEVRLSKAQALNQKAKEAYQLGLNTVDLTQ